MTAPVALHTVFGGTTFLICIALVIGTLLVLLDLRLREAREEQHSTGDAHRRGR